MTLPLLQVDLGDAMATFTSRDGGVSDGPYASLNLGLHVGDDAARVDANRQRVADALGLSRTQLRSALQVHGTQVYETGVDDERSSWGKVPPEVEADAVLTRDPTVALAVMVADCAPVGIAARDGIAVVHAGWRSLVGGILERVHERLDLRGARAAVGPCIGPCCFEVGEEVAERFAGASVVRRRGAPRPFADVRAEIDLRLRALGVGHVEVVDTCTACDGSHFSHRRDVGATGRQAIVLQHAGASVP